MVSYTYTRTMNHFLSRPIFTKFPARLSHHMQPLTYELTVPRLPPQVVELGSLVSTPEWDYLRWA